MSKDKDGVIVTDRVGRLDEKLKTPVDKMLQDKKKVAVQDEFTDPETKGKDQGVTAGYFANRRTEDHHRFIFKHAYKTTADAKAVDEKANIRHFNKLQETAGDSRRDFVNEYISGSIYNILLYDRAPQIGLTGKDVDPKKRKREKELYLRSKFLGMEDFEILDDFVNLFGDSQKFPNRKVKEFAASLSGFEKVVAACVIMGELDYHSKNLGVVSKKNEEGLVENVVVKFDHGRSIVNFHGSEAAIRDDLNARFGPIAFNYRSNIPFDVKVYRESVEQMLKNLSPEETKREVDRKIEALLKEDFDFNGIKILFEMDGKRSDILIEDFDKGRQKQILGEHFKSRLLKQRSLMQEHVRVLEVIEKIDMLVSWKSGKWLADINGEDPIVWAIKNHKTIEGKDPIIWAADNNRLINGVEPFKYAVENKIGAKDPGLWGIYNKEVVNGKDFLSLAAEKGITIGGKDPLMWAVANKKQIDGMDPIIWKLSKKVPLDEKAFWAIYKGEKIDGLDPIMWALNQGKKINGEDPIAFAIEINRKIAGIDPIIWAVEVNYHIADKNPIVWAVEHKKQIDGLDPMIYAIEHNKFKKITKAEDQMEILNKLLGDYKALKEDPNSKQGDILAIEEIYNKVAKAFNGGVELKDAKSGLGDLAVNNPKAFRRKILSGDKLSDKIGSLSEMKLELYCSLDVVYAVSVIGDKIAEKEGVDGGEMSTKNAIKSKLEEASISKKTDKAIDELAEISKMERGVDNDVEQDKRSGLRKFSSRVASGRSQGGKEL